MSFLISIGAIDHNILKRLYYLIVSAYFRRIALKSGLVSGASRGMLQQKDDPALKSLKKYASCLRKDKTPVGFENDPGAGSRAFGLKRRSTLGRIVSKLSTHHRYGKLLYYIVKAYEPQNILELGTAVGIGTLYLASGSEKSQIRTIEGSPERIKVAKKIVKAFGIRNVLFHQGLFHDVLPGLLKQMPSVDMVFIDGDHKEESTLQYFQMILEYKHDGTIVVFDDIRWSAGMLKAWKKISSHTEVGESIDLFRMGVVILGSREPIPGYQTPGYPQ